MTLEQIQQDMMQSMRDKNGIKTSTLRMLISAVKYFEIAKGRDYKATEQEITDLIQKEVKKRRESIDMYKTGNRPELAEKEQKELEVLAAYLPKQMGEEEIRMLVKEAIAKTGAASLQDIGRVMGTLMPQTKGKADGSLVGKIVREELGK